MVSGEVLEDAPSFSIFCAFSELRLSQCGCGNASRVLQLKQDRLGFSRCSADRAKTEVSPSCVLFQLRENMLTYAFVVSVPCVAGWQCRPCNF